MGQRAAALPARTMSLVDMIRTKPASMAEVPSRADTRFTVSDRIDPAHLDVGFLYSCAGGDTVTGFPDGHCDYSLRCATRFNLSSVARSPSIGPRICR